VGTFSVHEIGLQAVAGVLIFWYFFVCVREIKNLMGKLSEE
jgi:hypothetical protein